jgi:hypothetical protein
MSYATRWIVSRRFDGLFFLGSSVLAVAVGGLCLAVPALVLPMFLAFLCLVEGPHLLATWSRTYLDPHERVERRRLLAFSLLWFVPGLVAYGLWLATGTSMPLDAYLVFATFWSWHHLVRQHYGVMAIYQRLGTTTPTWRRLDTWFLYAVSWAAFFLLIVGHPHNRALMGLPPSPAIDLGLAMIVALVLAGIAGYALLLLVRLRRGLDARAAWFVLLPVVGSTVFSHAVIAPREPVLAAPATPEQAFLVMTLVGGIVHGLQYLGIVMAANRRRFQARPAGTLAAWFVSAPWKAYLVLVGGSLAYLALSSARGAVPELSLFAERTRPGALFLVVYWGLFFHHYYLDQKIWRVGSEPRLRTELGLA